MKTTITTILLILSLTTFAQRKEIQLVISPTYSTRFLDARKGFRRDFNEIEKGMISYDFGILIYPFIKKRIAVGTGLIYTRKGFIQADYTDQDLNGNTIHIKAKETVNYLEIPIRVTVYPTDNAKSYLLAGLSNDIFLSSEMEVAANDFYNPNQYEIRKYNLGINLGLGYNFELSESMAIGVEPNIKFQTMNYISMNTRAKRFLYTIGLTMIAKWNLK